MLAETQLLYFMEVGLMTNVLSHQTQLTLTIHQLSGVIHDDTVVNDNGGSRDTSANSSVEKWVS